MRQFFTLFALLLLAAPAHAYRKPRNPNRKKKRAAVETSTATVKVPPSLPPMRWTPEVRAALLEFATQRGEGSPNYDAAKPPIAVLPFNDFAVKADPCELVFARLVREARFNFSEEFWKEIPLAYGRQRLRAAYEQFSTQPQDIWEQQPTYHQFCKGLIKSYQEMCVKLDVKDCRAYLARLTIGFKEDDFLKLAQETLDQERARPLSVEEIPDADGDPAPARIRRGYAEIPEARALVAFFLYRGIQVWFMDADAKQVLKAAAEGWGVPEERLLGIRQGRFRERFDGEPVEPIPVRGGEVDALIRETGRPADLVVGRNALDIQLLDYGKGVRIALSGDPRLEAAAKKRGWLIQPAF